MENSLVSSAEFLASLERDRESQRQKKTIAQKIISEQNSIIAEADRALKDIDSTELRFKGYLSNQKDRSSAPAQKEIGELIQSAGNSLHAFINSIPIATTAPRRPYGSLKRPVLQALYDVYPHKITPMEIAEITGLPVEQVRPVLKEGKDRNQIIHDRTDGKPMYGITPAGAEFINKQLPDVSLVKQGDDIAA